MWQLDLRGPWQVRQTGQTKKPGFRSWLPATVPGCLHTDLLAAGKIPDPFAELNELRLGALDLAAWEYRRVFRVPKAALAESCRRLVCEGLDTEAVVYLNDKLLGRADNMFRRWAFDAGEALREGRNELRIVFTGAVAAARKRARGREPLPGNVYSWGTGRSRRTDRNYLRKAQYQFGWDWGPHLPTCGVWQPLRLECFSTPRLDYLGQTQRREKGAVCVKVTAHLHVPKTAAGKRGLLRVRLNEPDDKENKTRPAGFTASTSFRTRAGQTTATAEVTVKRPRLWWPAGQGKQPLYALNVEVLDEKSGTTWDAAERRTGLRQVELVNEPDAAGESFYLRINGRPVFLKGANWIPADPFPTRVSEEKYRRLLESAAEAGMNAVRVWGGGIYENDVFYDLCDELGLFVWHDHMFACAAYPADRDFLQNVEEEVRRQVRRLSLHPCIGLWCGNNENEQGLSEWWLRPKNPKAKEKLRRDYLRLTATEEKATRAEAPDLPWWPGSPSTDGKFTNPNDHRRGDSHFWEVWHRRKPFSRYLEIRPRFNSEFGFQSFPDWETLKPVLGKDRAQWNLTSPVMEQHQRHGSGNAIITETMCSHFRVPRKLEDFFYVSQLVQGLAIKAGVECWRRLQPECMGTLYWQLNDCWPVASWASLDSACRWKALHYFARRFYAPLLISAFEDVKSGRVEVWLTSDAPTPLQGKWSAELWTWSGEKLRQTEKTFRLPERRGVPVLKQAVKHFADSFDRRAEVFLRLRVAAKGKDGTPFVNENTFAFAPYKRAELKKPRVTATVAGGPGKFVVTLRSDVVAPFTELHTGRIIGRFDDNFRHLYPGETKRVGFRPYRPTTPAALRKALRVRTLYSTYG